MSRRWVIGDVHGCNKTLVRLLFDNLKVSREDELFFLGDYIDRGPDSKGVVDTLWKLKRKKIHIHTLRGNHEQMMMESEQNSFSFAHWTNNGGETTLLSFGQESYSSFPARYKSFFTSLPYYIETGNFILVHAGLNFEEPDLFSDKEAMLWQRIKVTDQAVLGDRIMIHGHTPIPLDQILSQTANCRNLDGGCVFAPRRKDLGYLVAYLLEEGKYAYEKCIDWD